MSDTDTKPARSPQPKCVTCNHAASFHPRSERCFVVGCTCEAWAAQEQELAYQA